MEPSFPVDNTCQAMQCDELIICAALPNKLPLSQPRNFLTFTILIPTIPPLVRMSDWDVALGWQL